MMNRDTVTVLQWQVLEPRCRKTYITICRGQIIYIQVPSEFRIVAVVIVVVTTIAVVITVVLAVAVAVTIIVIVVVCCWLCL